jgi:PAS domain S-box-containing protein
MSASDPAFSDETPEGRGDESPAPGSPEEALVGLPDTVALQLIARSPFSLVVTDPGLPDNPIIYANQAFFQTTGYTVRHAIGRNCRFLQGPGTDPATVARIRAAIAAEEEITVDILNYTAAGAPFWNRLLIAPLSDPTGQARYCLGVQKPLGAERPIDDHTRVALREVQHRVKNHLALVVSLIRMEGRGVEDGSRFQMLARRVEGLRLLYDELTYREGENAGAIELGGFLTRVAGAVAALDPRGAIAVTRSGQTLTVPADMAVQLGLIVSELCANSLRHGFAEDGRGTIAIDLSSAPSGMLRIEVSDRPVTPSRPGAGPGVEDQAAALGESGGLGARIVAQLVRSLGGRVESRLGPEGMTTVIETPASGRA